jgi:hypothetical protein
MSFENVTLPDFLLADLFKNIFIINETDPETLSLQGNFHENSPVVKFLGNNEKNITILLRHAAEVFLPDRHLDFLTKILVACQLNIADVAIVNEGSKFLEINTLKAHLNPRQIILFGIDPAEIKLPLHFPHFKVQHYAGSTYLSVPSLDQLNIDTDEAKLLKTKLWVCLKSLFEVNGSNK